MNNSPKPVFAAIDLKSFYASVECVERGLDPLTELLVVADESRTDKTICLAVSPALKAYGLSGRCRLFEVRQKAAEVLKATGHPLTYYVAPPRMQLYMDYSARIYEQVYLRFIAPEDIHVYSIDEVFIDLSRYIAMYQLSAHDLVRRIIKAVLDESGITATAGIGSNLYLAKVAMDIVAKHVPADQDGVRIAELNELSYRHELWDYRPITAFWRVARGIAERLGRLGCQTMGDVARMSLNSEDVLYKEFGVDAELLIDHAWGYESCTMADIKNYHPSNHSVSAGQVLAEPYPYDKARLIINEMAEALALELFSKKMKANSLTLTVCYDREAVDQKEWKGAVTVDRYGRKVPKESHGTKSMRDAGGAEVYTNSVIKIVETALSLYDKIIDPSLTVRRIYITLNNTVSETDRSANQPRQLDFFSDVKALENEEKSLHKEQDILKAVLDIRQKFGKNAILRGISYQDGATARERNLQIGGHAAGISEDEAHGSI